jgi:hypothetical protein
LGSCQKPAETMDQGMGRKREEPGRGDGRNAASMAENEKGHPEERAVYLEIVEVLKSFKINNRASASSNRTLNPPR